MQTFTVVKPSAEEVFRDVAFDLDADPHILLGRIRADLGHHHVKLVTEQHTFLKGMETLRQSLQEAGVETGVGSITLTAVKDSHVCISVVANRAEKVFRDDTFDLDKDLHILWDRIRAGLGHPDFFVETYGNFEQHARLKDMGTLSQSLQEAGVETGFGYITLIAVEECTMLASIGARARRRRARRDAADAARGASCAEDASCAW